MNFTSLLRNTLRKAFSLAILVGVLTFHVQAQNLDLLIKGGHVIDPKNGINRVMDVGIAGGRIAAVEQNIPADRAATVVHASGLYVTPGLIDLHTHVFFGTEPDAADANSYRSQQPDAFSFRTGVTTMVDVGSAGWKNIRTFIEQTVEHSDTRVLAFLNIVGLGMRGGAYEQDLGDMDAKLTAIAARRYRDVVVGIKLAHYSGHDWTPTDRAVEAGRLAGLPVMIDFGGATPFLPIEELFFQHLRPGDIFTHAYGKLRTRESIVDDNGTLKPFVLRAQQHGIVFDVGHGGGSFAWSQAVPATQQGLWPNSISTDLHVGSMNGPMKDMNNVMSKYLILGMPLDKLIAASSWNPAQYIKRPELGNLNVGAVADVALLDIQEGEFGYVDVDGTKMMGNRKIETEMTIREGRIVWDLNGLSAPLWSE